MANILVIAEKSSAAKDFENAIRKAGFPDNYTVVPLAGHVMTLAQPGDYKPEWAQRYTSQLPMIPEKFKHVPIEDKVQIIERLKKTIASGNFDMLISAADAGREGELIVELVREHLDIRLPMKRLWLSQNDEKSIIKAFQNLRTEQEMLGMKNSAKIRQYLDWLLGMNLSRAASAAAKANVKVGRVMTPTLALVVNRELAILDHAARNYYQIEAEMDFEGTLFKSSLVEKDTIMKFDDEGEANRVKSHLIKPNKATRVDSKTVRKNAPHLYSLSHLQMDANKIYGFTAEQTLALAQSLYEKHKVLSYPRTSATVIPEEMVPELGGLLQRMKETEYSTFIESILADSESIKRVAGSKTYVDNSKLTDHYALVPTGLLPSGLTPDMQKIFGLVMRRFLAIFMPPQVLNETSIYFDNAVDSVNDKYGLRANGSVEISPGYTVLYGKETKDTMLPEMQVGDMADLLSATTRTFTTKPPSRYTEGTLIADMLNVHRVVEGASKGDKDALKEARGIGEESTRSAIIKKLQTDNYVSSKGKQLMPTQFGMDVIKLLEGKKIISPILTAEWEQKIKQIQEGKLDYPTAYSEMIELVKEFTAELLAIDGRISKATAVGKCPVCGSSVVESKAYYLCSRYKDPCSFIVGKETMGTKISVKDMGELLGGGELEERKLKNKEGRDYSAKLRIVDGRIAPVFANSSGTPKTPAAVVGKCPICGEDLKESEKYFICSKYKASCTFIIGKSHGGSTMTKLDIDSLMTNKETTVKDFVSKAGKPYKAKFKIVGQELKLEFA
jgi:DNA topoisomerase III